MKIICKGKPGELAGFVLELQGRPQTVEVHGILNEGTIRGSTHSYFSEKPGEGQNEAEL